MIFVYTQFHHLTQSTPLAQAGQWWREEEEEKIRKMFGQHIRTGSNIMRWKILHRISFDVNGSTASDSIKMPIMKIGF